MNAQIVCRVRSGRTESFRLSGEEAIIGRERGLAVTIPADGVSRRHAKISFDGKQHWLQNLSPAGTFLNGRLVRRERLRHLDVVSLGRSLDLLFLIRDESQGLVTREGITRAALVPVEGAEATYEILMGEATIGRSAAANVLVEGGPVSKIHARLERNSLQLTVNDLDSANGTFVNGARIMTALLQDGDVLSLANVVSFRVKLERGVVATTGERSVLAEPEPKDERARFSPQWKTRYNWDSGEFKEIAALQARLEREEEERKKDRGFVRDAPRKGAKPEAADKATAAKAKAAVSAAASAVTAPPVAPKPAAAPPAAAKPAATPPAAKPAAAPPAAKPPAVKPAPTPPVAAKPAPAKPVPAPPAAAPGPIVEISLVSPKVTLKVGEPGSYDIGRAVDAPLRIEDNTVSRRHSRLILSADRARVQIEHLGGLNGTQVNGVVITQARELADGDVVALGEVELTVRLTRG